MATRVSDADLHAMLEVVNINVDVNDLPPVGFPIPLLQQLCEIVSCDLLSACVIDLSGTLEAWDQEFPTTDVTADPEAFRRHYWACEPCSYPDRTGDTHSVITISDFYSQREFHETGMYVEYLGPLGVEHEIIVSLPLGHERTVRLLFARGDGSDFSERDRAVLTLLRPHLDELLRQADSVRRGTPELTPRQWELLRLVAGGYTNAQIARRLVVSEATVRKHIENIFQRLDVTNRTAAVACAFPDRLPA
jgi:DNA-binding CsgD family transcriptional regulator